MQLPGLHGLTPHSYTRSSALSSLSGRAPVSTTASGNGFGVDTASALSATAFGTDIATGPVQTNLNRPLIEALLNGIPTLQQTLKNNPMTQAELDRVTTEPALAQTLLDYANHDQTGITLALMRNAINQGVTFATAPFPNGVDGKYEENNGTKQIVLNQNGFSIKLLTHELAHAGTPGHNSMAEEVHVDTIGWIARYGYEGKVLTNSAIDLALINRHHNESLAYYQQSSFHNNLASTDDGHFVQDLFTALGLQNGNLQAPTATTTTPAAPAAPVAANGQSANDGNLLGLNLGNLGELVGALESLLSPTQTQPTPAPTAAATTAPVAVAAPVQPTEQPVAVTTPAPLIDLADTAHVSFNRNLSQTEATAKQNTVFNRLSRYS
ncbi:MAG: hypothetical protein KC476_03335 [Cyanobacteria bacterium HKST-UBA06]|nr:hypothetical protein [Cyanobacteria bacterium HKST-UBA06]